MDISLFTAASQSLGVIKTIAEGMVSIRDQTKLMELRIELLSKLFDAMQSLDALRQEHQAQLEINRTQKQQLEELQEQLSERESYELFEVTSGAYVYARKPSDGQLHKPPYICQPCQDQGIKSILRLDAGSEYFSDKLICPSKPLHDITLEKATRSPPSTPRITRA